MRFMEDDFLLAGSAARALYHQVAGDLPIYDYHCHLQPKEIYENKPYGNIGEMMLAGDHYKWRAMRAAGIPESLITGRGGYYEKFLAFARALEEAPGNPLTHWTHLELRRAFGIEDALDAGSAPDIWRRAGERLRQEDLRPRALIERFSVKLVCTTDDPADDLAYHRQLALEGLPYRVLPAFRPDRAMNTRREDFAVWVGSLGAAAGKRIAGLGDFLEALEGRLEAFHDLGARVSDHALDDFEFVETGEDTARRVLREALAGRAVSGEEFQRFRSFLLVWLGEQYARRGWVQQYHIGAVRNPNSRMFRQMGPDTGFDTMGDREIAAPAARLLDALEKKGSLPKTILYPINPGDNYALGALIGSFQGETRGKMQLGSAWWFGDQRDGIRVQLRALANLGLLGAFVGMLTDSRSFLSYTRHEYFRRVLCDLIGGWAEAGEIPDEPEYLLRLVENICYYNAVRYFGIGVQG